MFFTLTVRNKRVSKLLKISIYVLFTGIYSLAIEICINDWQGAQLHLDWAHFVLIPCACIAAVVVFIDSQKKLKEEIRKKMFM